MYRNQEERVQREVRKATKRKYKWRRILRRGLKPSSIDWQESKPWKSRSNISLHFKTLQNIHEILRTPNPKSATLSNLLLQLHECPHRLILSTSIDQLQPNKLPNKLRTFYGCPATPSMHLRNLRRQSAIKWFVAGSCLQSWATLSTVKWCSKRQRVAVCGRFTCIVLYHWYHLVRLTHLVSRVDLWPRLACPTFGCCWTPGKLGWSASISSVHVAPSDSVHFRRFVAAMHFLLQIA